MTKAKSAEGRSFSAPAPAKQTSHLPAGFVAPSLVEGSPPFLREKISGMVWPYSASLAERGDLVEAYWGDEGAPQVEVVPEVTTKTKPKPPAKSQRVEVEEPATPVADVLAELGAK